MKIDRMTAAASAALAFSSFSFGQTTAETQYYTLHAYHSAGEVLSWCESANTVSQEVCRAYIMASSDMLGAATMAAEYRRYCNPGGVKVNQLQKVIVKGLNERPQQLHMPASIEIVEVLAEAFPCK
jgi:hypothetical protein